MPNGFLRRVPSSDGADRSRPVEQSLILKIVQGLYVVTDIYPFHLQARKVALVLQIWWLLIFLACLVKFLDDGQPCISICITFRVWVSCSSNYVRGYSISVVELTSCILAGGGHTVLAVFIALWSFYLLLCLWKRRKWPVILSSTAL